MGQKKFFKCSIFVWVKEGFGQANLQCDHSVVDKKPIVSHGIIFHLFIYIAHGLNFFSITQSTHDIKSLTNRHD